MLARCFCHETNHLDGITMDPDRFYEDDYPTGRRKSNMRILFMGTPEIAAASLQALLSARGTRCCGCYPRG